VHSSQRRKPDFARRPIVKDNMKIALFVAAAIAAGGYSFAASAGQMDAGSVVKRVARGEAATLAVKSVKKGAVKKIGSAARTKVSAKGAKASGNRTATVSKVRKGKMAAARAGKRQRLVIDTTKTASIANGASLTTGSKALKSGAGVMQTAASVAAFSPIVSRYAAEYGVPVSLAHAVIRVESNYRVSARGSAGEIGLMQIKPATARMMGYRGSAKGLFDPETNIRFGIKYMAMAHDLGGGDTCGTILRYNAGHAATRMNPVSAAYCQKVKQHLAGL